MVALAVNPAHLQELTKCDTLMDITKVPLLAGYQVLVRKKPRNRLFPLGIVRARGHSLPYAREETTVCKKARRGQTLDLWCVKFGGRSLRLVIPANYYDAQSSPEHPYSTARRIDMLILVVLEIQCMLAELRLGIWCLSLRINEAMPKITKQTGTSRSPYTLPTRSGGRRRHSLKGPDGRFVPRRQKNGMSNGESPALPVPDSLSAKLVVHPMSPEDEHRNNKQKLQWDYNTLRRDAIASGHTFRCARELTESKREMADLVQDLRDLQYVQNKFLNVNIHEKVIPSAEIKEALDAGENVRELLTSLRRKIGPWSTAVKVKSIGGVVHTVERDLPTRMMMEKTLKHLTGEVAELKGEMVDARLLLAGLYSELSGVANKMLTRAVALVPHLVDVPAERLDYLLARNSIIRDENENNV